MNTKIDTKQFFIISLMLFSMFFGAGNFIFPPMVGMLSGDKWYIAVLFFCTTGVALPVLGVAAVAKAKSLPELATRVSPLFNIIFVTVIYITIGPLLAIPRAGNLPFEISLVPFLPSSVHEHTSIWLAVYSAVYFLLNWYVCINPSKMTKTLGEFLTPVMLVLIVVLFVAGLMHPIGDIAAATGKYAVAPASTGFIEGYQTLDALAALAFGIVVAGAIRNTGVDDDKSLTSYTIKAGVVAGIILMLVYVVLGYLGATSSSVLGNVKNEAKLLSDISYQILGTPGRVVLGITFFIACFTTTTGLIGSVSSYFESIMPKIAYKKWVVIWTFLSFLVANLGLTQILKISVPILIAVYPVAIVLIILSLLNALVKSSGFVYKICVYPTVFIGIVNALDIIKIKIPFITQYVAKLPFYSSMLGWVAPAIILFIIGLIVSKLTKNK